MMDTLPDIQLLIEERGSCGTWNMAADEFLLLRALETGQAAVRIYSWSAPTVSLGYFQNPATLQESRQFTDLPAVRRLSGGGAILHDLEITYSLAVPPRFAPVPAATHYYQAAHSGIIRALSEYDIAAVPRGNTHPERNEPFLCFSRGDRNDLLLHGVKVAGSAQRRRKGAVLQHGSILLRASEYAPELPGIEDLTPGFTPRESIRTQFGIAIFSELLHVCGLSRQAVKQMVHQSTHSRTGLTADELRQIRVLENTRYRDLDQIRRTPVTGTQP